MKKQLLLFVMFLLPMVASADAVEIGGIYYNLIPNGNIAEVTSNPNYYSGSVVIPESVTYKKVNYSVTSVGESAFTACTDLTSVTIPNSVKSIGYEAFMYCFRLTSVTIPNSVISIGKRAFERCSSLNTVIIPNSVTSIGNFAFKGCSSLNTVTIPNSVTSIGNSAFEGCSSLTSIFISKSVVSFGESVFSGCPNLESINVESDNRYYDSRNNCNAIIKKSDNTLILGCKNTTIPNSVLSIGGYAFSGSGLTSIAIPNSVKSIDGGAFYGCSGLTSVTIPNSVTSIGPNPFMNCDNLESIKIESGNASYDSREDCNAIIRTSDNTLIIGCKNTTIPISVTSIGEYSFSGCSSLTRINIPNSVTSIGRAAFEDSGLTSITIPNSITSIGNSVFYECHHLTSVNIPNSITTIGIEAFLNCFALTSITIPNSVTTIEEAAFYGCENATSISIGSGVQSIGLEAFYDCCNVTDVYCYATNVPNTDPSAFVFDAWEESNYATLHVPAKSVDAYKAAEAWKIFKSIEGMLYVDPIEGETTVNTDNLNGQDLSDNVVDGVYYNVGEEGYDATDGSIVIGETTNMGQITDSEPGSEDVKNNFTGIILKVAAGKGTIKVNVKTSGNAQLVVQVGNGTPMIASKTEQGDVVISYDVAEDTYVYIYAIIGSSASPSMRASSTDEVRIYGFTVSPEASGIKTVENTKDNKAVIYNLNGVRLSEPQKGLNIINGKKYVKK